MKQEYIRRGPWTEQEDLLLINFVHLLGDRRWDFIAKVSGLNRTGKSCRLRWVNYLQPGLKREKMTTHEEKLIIELQAKWGNRWSRIARKLPGRTDNEIKNYWRTLMRKKAQERKKAMMCPSSSSSNSSSSSIITTTNPLSPFPEVGEAGLYETNREAPVASAENTIRTTLGCEKVWSVDDIWEDIGTMVEPKFDGFGEEGCNFSCLPMSSPPWQYFPDTLWMMEEEESKMFSLFENGIVFFTS